MTFGSLFAGIGGLDLGLEQAGMECRWQVEIDSYCRRILARHWPGVKRYDDIRKLTGADLEPVDLICGGFPCQDLSQAGKRAGIEGTRSGLWFEFARLVGELRPRYVLIENVPGILVHDAIRRVVGELARCGYVGCYRSLRAAEFGAPHLRKRVFIVAHRAGGRFGELRQSSGCERFAYGSNTELADTNEERQPRLPLRTQSPYASTGNCVSDPNGSNHQMADSECPEWRPHNEHEQLCEGRQQTPDRSGSTGRALADEFGPRLEERTSIGRHNGKERPAPERDCGTLERFAPGPADPPLDYAHCESRRGHETKAGPHREDGILRKTSAILPPFAPGPADPRWLAILAERPDLAPALESPVRGMADGFSDRMDRAMRNRTKRLGRLGNAVVPEIAEWIGTRILEFQRRIV